MGIVVFFYIYFSAKPRQRVAIRSKRLPYTWASDHTELLTRIAEQNQLYLLLKEQLYHCH